MWRKSMALQNLHLIGLEAIDHLPINVGSDCVSDLGTSTALARELAQLSPLVD